MNPQDPYYQPQPPQPTPPASAPTGQSSLPPSYPYAPSTPQSQPYAPAPANTYSAPQVSPPQPAPFPPTAAAPDTGQYPVDYLNQIAAPVPQKTINKFAVFGLMFGFLALVITAVLVLSGAGTPNITTQATLTRDRVYALKIVTTEQQKHLADNGLSSLNATLTASLTTISTDLTELLGEKTTTSSSSSKPKDKTIIADQAALSQKLNDAYLTGTLDRTYASEMSYQLKLLTIQLKKLATSGKTAAAKNIYTKNYDSLNTIATKLADTTSSQ